MSEFPVTVYVANGVINCQERGGHVKAKRQDKIHWKSSGEAFTLAFTYFPEGDEVWPFSEPEPTWPVDNFVGTLAPRKVPAYYKYTVEVGSCPPLDPIVIVDH